MRGFNIFLIFFNYVFCRLLTQLESVIREVEKREKLYILQDLIVRISNDSES